MRLRSSPLQPSSERENEERFVQLHWMHRQRTLRVMRNQAEAMVLGQRSRILREADGQRKASFGNNGQRLNLGLLCGFQGSDDFVINAQVSPATAGHETANPAKG